MSDDTPGLLAATAAAFRDHGLTAAITALIGGFLALIAAITRRAFTNEALLQRLDRELIADRTLGREHVCISPLIFGRGKIPQPEQAPVQECVEHVMDAACTDADGLGQVALAHFGVVLQKAQDPELHIFAQLVALCGHN